VRDDGLVRLHRLEDVISEWLLSVIVNELSNKELRLIRNPLITCRVTWMRDNIQFLQNHAAVNIKSIII
jgi:hypothetical protein